MMSRRVVAFGLAFGLSLHCVVPASAAGRRLPDGTRIAVRVMEQLSSASVKDGDPVNFAVVEDVVVDGQVVIKQGTPVRGVIVEAAEKRRMGRAGRSRMRSMKREPWDKGVVRLRAFQEQEGREQRDLDGGYNYCGRGVRTGRRSLLPAQKGYRHRGAGRCAIDTFVDGDDVVATEAERPAAAAPAEVRAGKLTNSDILELHKAGFGEELILAKIASSSAAFTVDATDSVALKKTVLSERVIAATVAAE